MLEIARGRPLIEALTVRRGKRKGEPSPTCGPKCASGSIGRPRAGLTYKTLVLTGLRKNELATLTVAQLRLDEPTPSVNLDAADEKNREGNDITIRADLRKTSALARRQARRPPGGSPSGPASRSRPGCP